MKAKDLAEMLLRTPDYEVYLSVDAEGNRYKKICDLDYPEIEEVDEKVDPATRCVVLYPV